MQTTNSTIARFRYHTSLVIKSFFKFFEDAKVYVGTDEISGQLQLELLKKEGCLSSSRVLEVGCGCLNAGVPVMRFLDKGNYVGIEPNNWLIKSAMKKPEIAQLIENKRPQFLNVLDFDASSIGMKFDFILSHSILSHAAHWQLEEFLTNTFQVLAPGGRILASVRLAEGNNFGSEGSADQEDSMDEEWVYPGVSWFKLATLHETAKKVGLNAKLVSEYTEYYTRQRPAECHDWFVFSR